MKNNIVYATTIEERADNLSKRYTGNDVEDNITNWISRKSLCNKELFYYSLKQKKMNTKSFNVAIKTLTAEDARVIVENVKKSEWYLLFQKIMNADDVVNRDDNLDFSYALRFHLQYFANEIDKVKSQKFNLDSSLPFITHLCEELLNITAKTLVFDLHKQKKQGFVGETPEERFQFYMRERFGSTDKVIQFYNDYPVLIRLLTERVNFHIKNFTEFIVALDESLDLLSQKFILAGPFKLHEISVGAGDSHGQGKSVILFNINERRFVFKFKNLEIGERLNQFFEYLEDQIGEKFYQVKRIIKPNYCIEEFVNQKECTTEDEVKRFYYRFGEYVALTYLLCGNDFHYENIVAHGEFPVLIDVETIIQNDSPLKNIDNPFSELTKRKYLSVLSTGLLPMNFQENRIEPLIKGKQNRGLRMSAFDGKAQVLPFKVLTLINPNTDNVQFEYTEQEMEGSNNIPYLNGSEISGGDYVEDVITGFTRLCQYFMENKLSICSVVNKIFANVIVRNVIKATQKYGDMINYSYHPSCMKNFTDREKLFENLWAFGYANKAAIQYEIEDMLVNDIPIFFNNSSRSDLISSKGQIINNYYKRTALDRVKERIASLDLKEFEYQKLRLKLSFDVYHPEIKTFSSGNNFVEILESIVEELDRRAIFNSNKDIVTFEDFVIENDRQDYGALNGDFYDGLSGIYLFLFTYCQYYQNKKAIFLRDTLENMLFKIPKQKGKLHVVSAYSGEYSILYPMLQKYRLSNNQEYIDLAKVLLKDIESEINNQTESDWLSGVSGIAHVLVKWHQATDDDYFIYKAQKLIGEINSNHVKLCGFSHGYAGVAVGLSSVYQITKEKRYLEEINNLIKKENNYFSNSGWEDLRENENTISRWCHGSVGIGLSRMILHNNGITDFIIKRDLEHCLSSMNQIHENEDGLCHGSAGRLLFINDYLNNSKFSKKKLELEVAIMDITDEFLSKGIRVAHFQNDPALGLMTGITGVGYAILKQLHSEIPNVLYLE